MGAVSLRWPLALAGSATAHALGWWTVFALWTPPPLEEDQIVTAVDLLDEAAPDPTVPAQNAAGAAVAGESEVEAGVAAEAKVEPKEALRPAPKARPKLKAREVSSASRPNATKPKPVKKKAVVKPNDPNPTPATVSLSVAETPPPPPTAAEPPPDDADKDKKNVAASGTGQGAAQSFKFARSATPDQGESAPATAYIGDRNVSAPETLRVATTTERSSGNARGSGEALPVPEAHKHDDRGELAIHAVATPSPEAGGGDETLAGAAPGIPAVQSLPDLSPVDVLTSQRKEPNRRGIAEALPEPASAPTDGFWRGDGAAGAGEGDAAMDSPAPTAGENVQRAVFKKNGAGWTEVTALEDNVLLGDHAAVSIRQTEVGEWFTPVDDLVRLGWRPPLDQVALGVSGRVTLQFVVKKNGRVTDLAMVDANVPLSLQEAALLSVPSAVAPPPRGSAPLRVRYVFRYGTTGSEVN